MSYIVNKDWIHSNKIHPKISEAIVYMISTYYLPFYGEFLLRVNFAESKHKEVPTCGVNVNRKGMYFYWNREWVDSKTQGEIIFTNVHEVMHLLFKHIKRSIGYDPKLSNIAQDMIINSIIVGDLIEGEYLQDVIEIPTEKIECKCGGLDSDCEFCKGTGTIEINNVVFLPKEYDGPPVFEPLYFWLIKKYKEWEKKKEEEERKKEEKKKKKDKGKKPGDKNPGGQKPKNEDGLGKGNKIDGDDGNPGGQSGTGGGQQPSDEEGDGGQPGGQSGAGGNEESDEEGGEPQFDYDKHKEHYGKNGQSIKDNGKGGDIDCYDLESQFERMKANKGQTLDAHLSNEVPDDVVQQEVQRVLDNLKNRGFVTGKIQQTLNKLRKKRKDHLKFIKRHLSNVIFGSLKRKTITRENRRGIPGLKGKRKYATRINCILDTSGSMGGEFEKVLSYIFQNDIEINLIQIDTEVKDVVLIKKKSDLQKMDIQGLGGTILTPGLQFIASRKDLNKFNTVILTDGYTDTLNFIGVKGKVLILSTGEHCEIENKLSSQVKQIIVEKNEY